MTSRDIEDVLVSIRRLVTEDLRPTPRATGQGEGSKLLLTPAHRVVPEPAGSRPETPRGQSAPAKEPKVDLILAALGRAVRDRGPTWESETGDPPPLRLESPVAPVASPAAPHHAGRVIRPAVRAAVPSPSPEAEVATPAPDIEVAAPPAVADPDIFLEVTDLPDFAREAPAWAQFEPDQPGDPASAEAVRGDPHAPLGSRDAAWSDAAEAAAREELEATRRAERVSDIDLDEVGAAPALDEARLREVVRDVLREELGGPLGERITRNIRKLVHQEIARALAVRNLD